MLLEADKITHISAIEVNVSCPNIEGESQIGYDMDKLEDVLKIIETVDWDVRILGEEYRDKEFTGRDQTLDKCYFNKRPHNFSSSELRERVSREHFKK